MDPQRLHVIFKFKRGTGEFPAQMASNAENVSIWWRHHVMVWWGITSHPFMSMILLTHVPTSSVVMMTSSNGNSFRVTGHLCGNSPVPGEFPTQRPVTLSFDVFFDLRLNKRLSKQTWGWWLETLPCPLWRHRNVELNRRSWKARMSDCIKTFYVITYTHTLISILV